MPDVRIQYQVDGTPTLGSPVGIVAATLLRPDVSGLLTQPGNAVGDALAALGTDGTPAPVITLDAVSAVAGQALREVMASLALTPSDQPGVLWRNGTVIMLSPNTDGTPYTAPYGAAQATAGLGALDPVTAFIPAALARVVGNLPSDPPSAPGILWLNNNFLALSPNSDGTPYPVTPVPSGGSGILGALRTSLLPTLTGLMAALPLDQPISAGRLWRSQSLLALSS